MWPAPSGTTLLTELGTEPGQGVVGLGEWVGSGLVWPVPAQDRHRGGQEAGGNLVPLGRICIPTHSWGKEG